MTQREKAALGAATALLGVTGAWWTLAFWPAPEASLWLARARSVCFGLTPTGLPDAAGWVALISQPFVMGAMFLSIWGKPFGTALATIGSRSPGRLVLALPVAAIALGIGAVSFRVAAATQSGASGWDALPSTYPRLDREAPPLTLVDQHGETVAWDRFAGTPALVTFAFGNCQTVCPVVIHDVREARTRFNEESGGDVAIVVITLDPWRDVPSRLPHLALQWELDGNAHVLGGTVTDVERALDAWEIPRSRDETTGDIVHPRLTFVVDYSGRLAYAVSGGPDQMVDLLNRL